MSESEESRKALVPGVFYDLDARTAAGLSGKTVSRVARTGAAVRIVFTDGTRLEVECRDVALVGRIYISDQESGQ